MKRESDQHFKLWLTHARTYTYFLLVICVQSRYDNRCLRVCCRKEVFYFMLEVVITEEIRKEYVTALYNCQSGYRLLLDAFKAKYPKEFRLINVMYRKRVAIKESLEVLEMLEEPIYWFTLTYNNDKDINAIETKRKEAQKFLNKISLSYLMIEEFGEDKQRYHVHGFLCFKYGYGFEDFSKWHSRRKIYQLKENKDFKKKIHYLTNYSVKSIPRIRRSKTLSTLYTYYKSNKSLSKHFPSVFKEGFNKQVANVINPF